ncbi:hypothetical protein [Burkholderia stabilis]|uniref:Uncharacterized protein n=1 Tax=Burkholderia stabilis TaxID=95485 RepID=A0A1Y1BVY8_9BURK|nr:hypothetical protein [Burkholderia stabilis]BAX64090.1 hypothetical protein BSFP_069630 [Burkholderia stabilis]
MKVRNAYTVGNSNKVQVAIGQLEEVQSFGNRPAMARGLPENMTATDGAAEELTPVFAAAASDNFYSQTEII